MSFAQRPTTTCTECARAIPYNARPAPTPRTYRKRMPRLYKYLSPISPRPKIKKSHLKNLCHTYTYIYLSLYLFYFHKFKEGVTHLILAATRCPPTARLACPCSM